MKWSPTFSLTASRWSVPVQKRRPCLAMGCAAEVCEKRTLLSATVIGTAHQVSNSGTTGSVKPAAVHDPSTGGANGTAFLAPDATPLPAPLQQQAVTMPAVNSFLAPLPSPTIGSVSTGLGTSAVANNSPLINATLIPQLADSFAAPAIGPSSAGDLGTGGFGTGFAGNESVGANLNAGNLNACNLNDALPSINLDLAFTPAMDLSLPL